MIQFCCDRCKRNIDPETDLRYVVKIEVQATMETIESDEIEDDRDHLLEIQEILNRLDDETSEAVSEAVYQRRCYDLCPECYRKFSKNPLGQEFSTPLNFSQN